MSLETYTQKLNDLFKFSTNVESQLSSFISEYRSKINFLQDIVRHFCLDVEVFRYFFHQLVS